jgi:hypothetical protein
VGVGVGVIIPRRGLEEGQWVHYIKLSGTRLVVKRGWLGGGG